MSSSTEREKDSRPLTTNARRSLTGTSSPAASSASPYINGIAHSAQKSVDRGSSPNRGIASVASPRMSNMNGASLKFDNEIMAEEAGEKRGLGLGLSSSSTNSASGSGRKLTNGGGGGFTGRGGVPQDVGEWQALGLRLQEVIRQWKRTWDKEGFHGVKEKYTASPLHKTLSSSISRPSSVIPQLSHLYSIIPPRRRFIIGVTSFLIFLFLLLRPSSSSLIRGHNPHLKILTGSGYEQAIVDRTTGSHRGENKAKVLESFSNPYGFINLVDPYAGGVFNPSILVLPDTVGAGFKHLLVARGPEKYEVIDGEDTRWESVLGCFLLPLRRPYLDLPYLARESELETLKLPAKRKMDFMRCHEHVYDQFIGPEDPRLFFTNDGQPLLIYSQTGRSPNICRAIFIIDARIVIPGLKAAMKKGGWSPPIIFSEQTDLIREDQFNIEKNWAPFLGEKDELFFHVSLVPQQIYKYVPGITLRALDPTPPAHNCLTEIIGAEMNRVKFHHATPLLRVTLCRRGECVPDIHNTVLMGMIHIKYHPLPYLFYERRVVTWNVTSPYDYLSVSKPLTYSGTNQADPIFTVAVAWDHPTQKNGLGLNHGFLDDVVVISFGVFDYGSAYIDVLARDMMTDHTLCTGVPGFRLW